MHDDDDAGHDTADDTGHDAPWPNLSLDTIRAPRSLRQFLTRNNRTEAWLAKKVGVRQSMISMLVNRKRATKGKVALKIHQITGVPLQSLMTLPKPRKSKR